MTSKKPDYLIAKAQTPAIKQFLKDAVDFGKLPRDTVKKRLKHLEKNVFTGGVLGKILEKFVGWSLPSKEVVDLIKNQKIPGPVYDVLAGTGYWTAALNAAGVKTHASDISISQKTNVWGLKPRYASVSKKNAVALAAKWANKGKPVNVLMSWIPSTLPVAALDLPKGSILFVVHDQQRYIGGQHDAFLNMSYSSYNDHEGPNWDWLGKTDVIDTGAVVNMYGDRADGNSDITAYRKLTDSRLKTESLVNDIIAGRSVRDIIESAVSNLLQ